MTKQLSVPTEIIRGGATVCACHGWSIRRIYRKSGEVEAIHCEHPERYIEYGDGYIPDYCEACGWNLGRYDRRIS